MKVRRKTLGRRRYALTLLVCLLAVELLTALFNNRNQTIFQAQRDLEIQRGWPKTQVIWEEKLGTSWNDRTRLRLHVLDGGVALVEYEWNVVDGWYPQVFAAVETGEGWPIQARFMTWNDYYKVYVIGYPTDPDIDLDRVTFGLCHWEDGQGFVVDPEDRITIAPEDRIYHEGKTYFVCEFDLSQRLTEEEKQQFGTLFTSVLVHVTDENGQPIQWEDGWADDFGEWMCLG